MVGTEVRQSWARARITSEAMVKSLSFILGVMESLARF